ncbi:S-layer homology domain-containing protein [Fusibacter sp. 3D3]|uniref:S-layer homology domain-containing protein n=1 Tax=Fusibacter sp. 3D3 TaxID=1048380 RepID=UPI000852C002|nr:S-layer homology domain-containing protein [Fusibacter sp. 3D3]GAU77796.1 outer cell wall protein precursor [Fusibacter sp. 3D3]
MKKVLSLVLVLAMVLGMMPVFAAGETGADQLYKYGFIAGNNGDLMVDKELTRAEMAVLVAEMNGLKEEAANYAAPANFSDVTAGKWYTPYVAYGQANGWWAGYPDGSFKPEIGMSGQEFASVLMKALKYDVTWNTVIADAAAVGVSVKSTASLTRGAAFDSMWTTVNTPAKGETVALGVKLGRLTSAIVSEGPLAVDTVTANTAKSFEIKFKNVVKDTTKVAFEVKRDTTKVALTAAWNEAKTVATLSSAAKFTEGNYEIVVSDATAATPVALGTFKVTIEKEKVAAVTFDSDTLLRLSDIQGVVGYKVVNQYGEDITDGSLGRSLQWISSTDKGADADEKTGVVTVTQGTDKEYNSQLRTFKTVVLTVRDTSSGFVSTKTLNVSDTISVVNEVKINGIVNEAGESVDFAYDTSKTYYLDVTVLDANGKEVKSYAILNATVGEAKQKILSVESTNKSVIEIKPEKHPKRSGEMAYRINFEKPQSESYDMPITFLALSPYSGKSATATFTLGRSSTVEKFVLQAPAITVSSGKTIEFPFEAFDQSGKVVTEFDKLSGKINLSGVPDGDSFKFIRQADGSAKLFGTFINATTTDKSVFLSSTIDGATTNSYSSISIIVKEKAIPETIQALAHPYAFTENAQWNRNISHMNIFDQFDNKMNLKNDSDNLTYQVKITSSQDDKIYLSTTEADSFNGTTPLDENGAVIAKLKEVTISGDTKVYFYGGSKYGSSTITYDLGYMSAAIPATATDPAVPAAWKSINTASTSVYNIVPKDIVSASVGDLEGTKILMLKGFDSYYDGTKITWASDDAEGVISRPSVYGKTSGGTIVRLPSSMQAGFTVNNNKFSVVGNDTIIAAGDFNNATTADATVTGLVYGANGILQASANITASNESPKASAVIASFDDAKLRNKTFVLTNDVATVTKTTFDAFNGKSLLYLNKNGTKTSTNGFKFKVNTQYGASTGIADKISVVKTAVGAPAAAGDAPSVLYVDSLGVAHITGVVAVGDEFSITASAGAYSKTIIFKVVTSN